MMIMKPVDDSQLGAIPTAATFNAAATHTIVGNLFASQAPTVTPGFWPQGASAGSASSGTMTIFGRQLPTWLVIVGLALIAFGGYKLYKRSKG